MSSLQLEVAPRGKPLKGLPQQLTVSSESSAAQIYDALAVKTKVSVHRIRVTKGSDGAVVPNSSDETIQTTGLLDGSKIVVKDLGPQLGWQFVYLVEYFGPLIIHPLMYTFREYIYASPSRFSGRYPAASDVQRLSMALIVAHYAKRELETLFVHRFSNATMPFSNIFKNCGHYWLLSGVFLGYFIYGPTSPAAASIASNQIRVYAGLALWTVGQLGNLNAHLVLMGLRSKGGKERGIPQGLGFNWVTCPNYMFEIIGWIGMCLITGSWSTAVFSVVGAVQMAIWAKGKEKRYRREFGNRYKKKSFVLLPGIY